MHDDTKPSTSPPLPVVVALVSSEDTAAHKGSSKPTASLHKLQQHSGPPSTSPPQPVVVALVSSEDTAAHKGSSKPTASLHKLQQRSGPPPLPPPKPPRSKCSKSPEPPPKPAHTSSAKPSGTPTPSSDSAAESSKPASPLLSSKKGSRIAQLQKQLQGSSSHGISAIQSKESPPTPLSKTPIVPVSPRQPLLPPQSKVDTKPVGSMTHSVHVGPRQLLLPSQIKLEPSSKCSDDNHVSAPPKILPNNADVDAVPLVLPPNQPSPSDDDDAHPPVPPRKYLDADYPEMEEPVVPDRGYTSEDVYGRSPVVATPPPAEEQRTDSPDLAPKIPDRNYSFSDVLDSSSPDIPPEVPERNYSESDVLGSPSKDELDDQRPPAPSPAAVDIDLRPPMPLPGEMASDPVLEPDLPKAATLTKQKAPHPPDAGVPKKYNTLPDRYIHTQTPGGRPLPVLPFTSDSQSLGVAAAPHHYSDPDNYVPQSLRQPSLPRPTAPAGYLQPVTVPTKPIPPSFTASTNRSFSEDLSSPPVPRKQTRKNFNKSQSLDVPPTRPPKMIKRPLPSMPPTKPSEPVSGALPPSRLRTVTAKQLPLPPIPVISNSNSSGGSAGSGTHSYDYVESWMWQVQSFQTTPPRGTHNPLFPSLEEIMSSRFARSVPPVAVPHRHTTMGKPPIPTPVEQDDDYEEMEGTGNHFQMSVERQVFQRLPPATQQHTSPQYGNVASEAPVHSRGDSCGYVPVEEPIFRTRKNTVDSLGYVPMNTPSEITDFIREKLKQDQAQYINIPKPLPPPPVKKMAAMDLESVEYYNVKRSRGGRHHMLDYLDVHSPSNYGNLPPPLPPKHSSPPPLPPKSTAWQARPPKQHPPVWLPPKPVSRPRPGGPQTPLAPAVQQQPRTIPIPPRNIPRRCPAVYQI